jgi:translation initiation factor 4E
MPQYECLLPNTDFMFFKSDVKPEWEDSKNKNGGKWVITLDKNLMKELPIQQMWEDALLSLIGCEYEDIDDINGLVLSLRDRLIRFSLWIKRDETARDVIKRIGTQFRKVCKVPSSLQVVYQLHANALKKHLDNDFIMSI